MNSNFTTDFKKHATFTAQTYGTKTTVEVDHSDLSLDEVMDAFQTLLIGMGYHHDSFKSWVIERAEEYNENDADDLKEKLEAWKFEDDDNTLRHGFGSWTKDSEGYEDVNKLEDEFFGGLKFDEKRMDIIGQNGNEGLHYRATDEDADEFFDKDTTKCYCGHTDYCDCAPEDESEFDDYGKRIEHSTFESGDEPEEDYDGQFDDWKNETPEDDLFEGDEWKANQKLVEANERYKSEVKKMNTKKKKNKK